MYSNIFTCPLFSTTIIYACLQGFGNISDAEMW